MNKGQKYSLTIAIVLLTIIVVVILISNWWQVVLEGKPNGPYHSSISIKEAKKIKFGLEHIFLILKNISPLTKLIQLNCLKFGSKKI